MTRAAQEGGGLGFDEVAIAPDRRRLLRQLIDQHLKPHIQRIDSEAYYPEAYLRALGQHGFFNSTSLSLADVVTGGVHVVEETAAHCMTTAFNVWCHLAGLTYVRNSGNELLKAKLLPELEDGRSLAGTGLSNPMKYYAGLDRLYVQAKRDGEYVLLSGKLPMVSNLGSSHWFGTVAALSERERAMVFVPCAAPGLSLQERLGFLGLNGSATYTCCFERVRAPREWIVADNADAFIEQVRGWFVLYQIPLALGVMSAVAEAMGAAANKQGGCNRYLPVQAEHIEAEAASIRNRAYRLAAAPDIDARWAEVLQIRLQSAYAVLQAVQAGMLHHGAAGYMLSSAASRRLREAYFFCNLTPTVRHLEKLHASGSWTSN